MSGVPRRSENETGIGPVELGIQQRRKMRYCKQLSFGSRIMMTTSHLTNINLTSRASPYCMYLHVPPRCLGYMYQASAPMGSHKGNTFASCFNTSLTLLANTPGSTTAWYTN